MILTSTSMANSTSQFNPLTWLADLTVCLGCMTRIPTAAHGLPAGRKLGESAWGFPAIGVIVGAVGGLAYGIAWGLGCPPLLASALAVGACVLVTGAFHEDGLADFADGAGGGSDPALRLEIMSDSRVGTYGAVAIGLSLILRVSALASAGDAATVTAALVAAGALSRGVLVPVMSLLAPARDGGLGAAVGTPPGMSVLLAMVLAIGIVAIVAPAGAGWAIVIGILVAIGMMLLSRVLIGGYTGDALGAIQQLTEIAVLVAIVAALN